MQLSTSGFQNQLLHCYAVENETQVCYNCEVRKKLKMSKDTVWATDIEILVTASMLESNVFVFNAYVDCQTWQHFRASEVKFHVVLCKIE